jgi:quinol monooxygenase YgiN
VAARLAIAVHLVIVGDALGDFMPLIEENARASLAHEPGCHRFDVCVDADDPARLFLYEVYADEMAFAAHLAAPHYLAFDTATRPMIASKTVARYRLTAA